MRWTFVLSSVRNKETNKKTNRLYCCITREERNTLIYFKVLEQWMKLVVKSSVVPQRPSRFEDRWRWERRKRRRGRVGRHCVWEQTAVGWARDGAKWGTVMSGSSQGTAGFRDSDSFQKATKMLFRHIWVRIFTSFRIQTRLTHECWRIRLCALALRCLPRLRAHNAPEDRCTC